jgi:hypothetical protein
MSILCKEDWAEVPESRLKGVGARVSPKVETLKPVCPKGRYCIMRRNFQRQAYIDNHFRVTQLEGQEAWVSGCSWVWILQAKGRYLDLGLLERK